MVLFGVVGTDKKEASPEASPCAVGTVIRLCNRQTIRQLRGYPDGDSVPVLPQVLSRA